MAQNEVLSGDLDLGRYKYCCGQIYGIRLAIRGVTDVLQYLEIEGEI